MRLPILTILAISCFTRLAAPSRPNIILMMADDMGMGDTSAYQDCTGNADAMQMHTPHAYALSKLGSRHSDHGMHFPNEQVQMEKPFFLY